MLGHVRFGAKTSVFYREQIEYPFFCHYLKDRENPRLPEAYMFETGSNQWRKFDEWPPKSGMKKALYLHAGGTLSFHVCPAHVCNHRRTHRGYDHK